MNTSPITRQFDVDEQNRKSVSASLGAVIALPDDVAGLYEMHHNTIANQLPDAPAEVAAALYASCRKHLVLGIAALLRCYASQAFRETRAAVEAAGMAGAIRREPENFRIFSEDRDEESRKRARKRFSSGNLFVDELTRLKKYYDKSSELSHTNRRTFLPHISRSDRTFSYQDLRQQDIPKLATNYLLWICATHLTILEVADAVFSEVQGGLVMKFRQERRDLGERLSRFDLQNQGDAYQWQS